MTTLDTDIENNDKVSAESQAAVKDNNNNNETEKVSADNAKKYLAKDVVNFLIEKFPACFKKDLKEVKPLKLGILNDVVEALKGDATYSKTAIRHGIQLYTKSWAYLAACKENVPRLDLEGKEVESVQAEHAKYAAEKLEASKKAFAEKHPQAEKKKTFNRNDNRNRNFKNSRNGGEDRKGFKNFRGAKNSRPRRVFHDEGFVNPSLESLNVNDRVFVQIGYDPKAKKISGRIKKIEREDVYVDLVSGMSLKLSVDNLFIYDESRVSTQNTDDNKKAE